MSTKQYTALVREFGSTWCEQCKGTGKIGGTRRVAHAPFSLSHPVSKMKFSGTCRTCGGTGQVKTVKVTEISLEQALHELNIVPQKQI
jgi:DnaJ-class molecular chaperone